MSAPILCVDFDGTLLAADGSIHPDDVAILADPAAAGARVVAATGRPLHSVQAALAPDGLDVATAFGFGLVLENGAALYEGAELALARSFAPELGAELLAAMREAPEITFLVFSADVVRGLHPSDAGAAMAARFHLAVHDWGDGVQEITKVVSVAATPEPLRAFAQATAHIASERAFSLETVLEFQAPGVDKASGLRALLADRGATGPVVVAGDGENDLPLFAVADTVVVPADAPETIRAHADLVVDVRERGILAPMLAIPRA